MYDVCIDSLFFIYIDCALIVKLNVIDIVSKSIHKNPSLFCC